MLPSNIPSDSSQKKIIRAFKKIGFKILPSYYGKGSHRLIEDPKTGTVITIQHKIYKEIIKSYCKDVDALGYDVNEFIRKL